MTLSGSLRQWSVATDMTKRGGPLPVTSGTAFIVSYIPVAETNDGS